MTPLGQAQGLAEGIQRGDRAALARALNLAESDHGHGPNESQLDALVDSLVFHHRPGAHVVGLTGPPGVGKSTLAGRLIREWRKRELRVAVLAMDPSSLRSGGALLGDRARMGLSGTDSGVFVRSMAAREQLGGLGPASFAAMLCMRAYADRVLIETVGVGQNETDVAQVSDHTVVVIQPASGDTLQFLKSGLMEIPDLVVVNKSDLGRIARRAVADLKQALPLLGDQGPAVLSVSARECDGVGALVEHLEGLREADAKLRASRRAEQLKHHIVQAFQDRHGRQAMQALGGPHGARRWLESFAATTAPSELMKALEARASGRG